MVRRAVTLFLLAMVFAPGLAQAQSKNPSFNVVNKSATAIREVYATHAGMENWGQSRLAGKTVEPGASFAVRLREDGNCIYDIRVVFTDGKTEDRKRLDTCKLDDVVVGENAAAPAKSGATPGATPTAAAPTSATPTTGAHDPFLRLINRGKSPVTEIYATPNGAEKRGDNLLTGGATLAPQATQTFPLVAGGQCSFDLRVVFADKQSRERKGADLCRLNELPVQ